MLDAVERGLDAVIVRPPWFYGPFQPPRQTTFFRMVRTGRFPVIGDGRQRRSMVYVDNLVEGVVRAELTPTPPGRGWWIADARPYAVDEIVETVGRALARRGVRRRRRTALRLPAIAGRVAERGRRARSSAPAATSSSCTCSARWTRRSPATSSVARAELGYEPKVELYEGMRRSIRWCVGAGTRAVTTTSLVTGGSGYFGRCSSSGWSARGDDVRVLDIDDTGDRPAGRRASCAATSATRRPCGRRGRRRRRVPQRRPGAAGRAQVRHAHPPRRGRAKANIRTTGARAVAMLRHTAAATLKNTTTSLCANTMGNSSVQAKNVPQA